MDKGSFTIATLNLQSGVFVTKGYWQYVFTFWKYWLPHSDRPLRRAADFMRRNDVDVSLWTEISDSSLRTGFTSQAHKIASLLKDWHHAFLRAHASHPISVEGSAVLSRFPISAKKPYPLTSGAITRVLGYALIELAGRRVHFFVAHLSLSQPLRLIQMKEIVDIINATEGPVILGGDFNTKDEALSYISENSRLKDCGAIPTFPSWNPKVPFDRIFISPEFVCSSLHVDSSSLFSDHLPLVAKISFAD